MLYFTDQCKKSVIHNRNCSLIHEKLYSYFCVQSSKYTIHVKVYFKYFSNTFRGNIDPSPKIFFPGSFFSRQLRCFDLEFRIKDPLTEIYEAETFKNSNLQSCVRTNLNFLSFFFYSCQHLILKFQKKYLPLT